MRVIADAPMHRVCFGDSDPSLGHRGARAVH